MIIKVPLYIKNEDRMKCRDFAIGKTRSESNQKNLLSKPLRNDYYKYEILYVWILIL